MPIGSNVYSNKFHVSYIRMQYVLYVSTYLSIYIGALLEACLRSSR